jgi:hypothetical protein
MFEIVFEATRKNQKKMMCVKNMNVLVDEN